jgi:hypothetical protein
MFGGRFEEFFLRVEKHLSEYWSLLQNEGSVTVGHKYHDFSWSGEQQKDDVVLSLYSWL